MISLGPISIEHPFVLAPMAGITNSPFRRLMRRQGTSLVVSELVSANGIEHGGERTRDLLKFHEEERPVGLQIFGEDEANLLNACRVVEGMRADFVDLNLGCPVQKVVKKGAGSAMCRDPIALGKILSAMVKSVRIPVTIKIRTGWDSDSRNALDVVHAATDAGVSWVVIHGRTRAQGYSGDADWDYIGNVKAKSSIPVIGNGDLTTPDLALRRYRDYGVDAVWVGRAALRNPFFFRHARALYRGEVFAPPGVEEYLDLVEQQKALLLESFRSERVAMLQGRKFLSWYASGFPGCKDFRRFVFEEPDPETLWKRAREFFAESYVKRSYEFLSEPFLMGGHG